MNGLRVAGIPALMLNSGRVMGRMDEESGMGSSLVLTYLAFSQPMDTSDNVMHNKNS